MPTALRVDVPTAAQAGSAADADRGGRARIRPQGQLHVQVSEETVTVDAGWLKRRQRNKHAQSAYALALSGAFGILVTPTCNEASVTTGHGLRPSGQSMPIRSGPEASEA